MKLNFLASKARAKYFVGGIILLALMVIFHAYGVPYNHYFIFLFLGLTLIVFPGLAIVDWLKIYPKTFLAVSQSFSVGLVSAILIAKFSRWLRAEFLLFLWAGGCFLWFLWTLVRRQRKPAPSPLPLTRALAVGLSLFFLAFFLILLVDNFSNGVTLPSGDLALRMRFYDGFLRIACVRELSHSLPPQAPFAAGTPLRYHYGMDLFFSLFVRYGGLDVFDVSHRLGLTFLAGLFILNLFLFLKALLRSDSLTIFSAFYLLFGSGGLAYFFSWLFHAPFTGNIFFNFYFHDLISLNSLLPSLALLFSGLLALHYYEKERRRGWLVLTSLFLASLFEFKVFLLIPIAGGLFLATVGQAVWSKRKHLLPVTCLTAVFSWPLVLTALSGSQSTLGYRFRLGPVDWVSHVLRELRLSSWLEVWSRIISGRPENLTSYLLASASVLIFLLGAFGLNLWAIPRAVKSLMDPSGVKSFLSGFFLVSMANFFGVSLFLGRLPRNLLNIYVFYAGLICLGIFFCLQLESKLISRKPAKRIMILVLLGLLVGPNTAIYLVSRTKQPETRLFSRQFLEAAAWVEKNTPATAVIIHPSDLRYICYLAGRRVVLDNSVHSYLPFHLPRPIISQRLADIDRFFRDPENNVDVLLKYQVSFVWVDKPRSLSRPRADSLPDDKNSAPLSLPAPQSNLVIRLTPVFSNEEHLIYEVRREYNKLNEE
jgi:hypothetical protein